MTDLLHWGSARFPHKAALWNRAGDGFGYVARRRKSVALATIAVSGLAGALYLGIGYLAYQRLATTDQATLAHIERANADLQDAVATLRDQLGAANLALNTAQSQIAAVSDQTSRQVAVSERVASSKADRVAQLTRELHLTEAQRVTLIARLSKAESDLAGGMARQQHAQAGIDQWQKQMQQLTADRDKAISERDRLRARVGELEQKLSMLPARQPPRPMAEAQPVPAPPAPAAASPRAAPAIAAAQPPAAPAAPAAVAAAQPPRAVVAVASGRAAQFERVLASAGVDVAHLFTQYGVRTGEGGPFIPAPRGQHADTTLSPEKFAALSRLLNALPVSSPLGNYKLGSPFGVRSDPINGRSSFHTGIDMLAPYMTPVYATGPGIVTFCGYRDDYGKVVEIDHGNGISTRYAHLHRQTVSVGERVAAHTQIGFLGSTGRATGPHVHYEVLVNGEPQDPEKFLSLAHLVLAAHH